MQIGVCQGKSPPRPRSLIFFFNNKKGVHIDSEHNGRAVAGRLVIQAPEFSSLDYQPKPEQRQYLVVNAVNERGIFGGLALNISINPDATPINKVIFSVK